MYNAPDDWTVAGASATSGPVHLLEVRVFRLVRPYDRTQRAAAGRELDADAERLATQLKGTVSSRRWLVVDGLDARSYEIAYAGKASEITFVLDDRREYELLCRRPSGAAAAPCAELLRSFQLRRE